MFNKGLVLGLVMLVVGGAWGQGVPRLERRGAATELVVDGKAMLMLGGGAA